jgi:hypothetical protein
MSMGIVRQIKCDICEEKAIEKIMGDGWTGWGTLSGKVLKDDDGNILATELALCPKHLDTVFEFINNLMGNNKE